MAIEGLTLKWGIRIGGGEGERRNKNQLEKGVVLAGGGGGVLNDNFPFIVLNF